MLHHEKGVNGVHRWHPHEASPADVITCAVMLNIHGAEVTSFPPEKLRDVRRLHDDGHEHGAGDHTAVDVVLFHGVADESHLPEHHTESTIGELLHVEAEDTWVELGSPEEINDNVVIGAGILGGGEVEAFDGEEGTEGNGEDIHG